jgi:4-hydroxybenzoate polyprenyltransferase
LTERILARGGLVGLHDGGAGGKDALRSARPPLAVDLDRTLIRTDSLIEHFICSALRHPRKALLALRALRNGKAHFKSAVTSAVALDCSHLPFNEALLDYLRSERHEGRELHLVTAADQGIADVVAEKTGVFASAVGSSDGINLKGERKLAYLEDRFPDGFSYAGDSAADVLIWRKARSAVLVGVAKSTRRAVTAMGCIVEHEIAAERPAVRDWIKLMRVHQWSKNLLLFVPLILGHAFLNSLAVIASVLGFLAMSLTASGTYVFNDISDVAADRAHPTKRRRPIARGAIDAGGAFVAALFLIAAGVALMASQSLLAAGLLLAYLAMSLAYSSSLKRLALVDIFVLGGLYTIRVLMGGYLAGTEASHWLLMFSFFFFFSLSMAKRHVEIVNAALGTKEDVVINGRGYRASDAPLTLATGIATSLLSVLIFSLYIANDMYPRGLYNHPQWLWANVILVMMWSSRIWLLSHRGELDDDPVSFALRDPPSLIMGAAVAVVLVLAAA